MIALLKYIPAIFGVVRTLRRNPKVRTAYEQAKRRRAGASSRRR